MGVAIDIYSTDIMIFNTTISATSSSRGVGVVFGESDAMLTDLKITASHVGVESGGARSRVKLNNSSITSSTPILSYAQSSVYVGSSMIAGGPVSFGGGYVSGGGTIVCAGVYDGNYTFYPNTCP